MLVACLSVAALAVGGTIAWLTGDDSVENTFSPGKVTTTVVEDFDDGVKRDVRIENTGNVDAWIRAKILITWQDENGNVYGQAPVKGTDYKISYNTDNQLDKNEDGCNFAAGRWTLGGDGFWYWSGRVAPGATTGFLITECVLANSSAAPEGYSLCVEVIGSGIQADGTTSDGTPAVVDAWGSEKLAVTVNPDGTLSVATVAQGE